ncbi:transglutaminase-like domain-containing protein [Streptomyces sp. NPDC051776]|uniref:transglutaminase-like domain-containing protein n=1 Tax=Streptomyces sp. NPDC051776 TaxID=3155414 RepID=UPI003441C1D0
MHDITGRRQRFAEAARAERPDLALLCLLVAAEADPAEGEAAIDEAQIELDRLAGQMTFRPARGAHGWAGATAELLGVRHGFHGTSADYRRLESSLLPHVLRRRRGLPILLSVVWMEVARRAGGPVYGVALPGHFVVGFGDPAAPEGPVLADPFDQGRLMTGTDAELLVTSGTGARVTPDMLEPAPPLEIVLRILNNIRAWAAARPERSDVQLWALDLSLLLPSHPARLRYDRAQLLVQRGDFTRGAAELEAYAEVIAPVDPGAAETVQSQALAARAKLN